ncbi:MAG: hypothetical protein DRP65_09585 [Planctomycetota bacterium]|nr:MAG: hypothetical protein DRP65_09585 [Planctomycetota bacterium]
MALARSVHQGLLNHFFGKSTYTAETIYVGLSSTEPTSTGGNVTEPSGGAYARVQTAASDWNSATAADPSETTNANEIAFAEATADWLSGADLGWAVFYSAASGGTFLGFGACAIARSVFSGDIAKFKAGEISVTLGPA